MSELLTPKRKDLKQVFADQFEGMTLDPLPLTVLDDTHNHPSGDPAPSAADIYVTRQLREAAKVIDIDLIDRVIVGDAKADPLKVG